MAVRNEYADSNLNASGRTIAGPSKPWRSHGTNQHLFFFATFTLAAADDNASIIRLWKCNPCIIPQYIHIANDTGLTGCNDVDLGVVKGNLGPVISAAATNCFADALDLSTVHNFPGEGSNLLYPMKDVLHYNRDRRLFEHAGLSESQLGLYPELDMALTFNAAGSGTGKISVMMLAAQG